MLVFDDELPAPTIAQRVRDERGVRECGARVALLRGEVAEQARS